MTLAVDFDNVVHAYSRGWDDGTIYDPPVPGAIAGLRALMGQDSVFIHTTREPEQVMPWLEQHGLDVTIDDQCGTCRGAGGGQELDADDRPARPPWTCDDCQGSGLLTFWNLRGQLLVTNRKLPAVAYLDDRAVRFQNWDQALTALGINPRLLDCGLCYEEWGEEVHPHPECPVSGTTATASNRPEPHETVSILRERLITAITTEMHSGQGPSNVIPRIANAVLNALPQPVWTFLCVGPHLAARKGLRVHPTFFSHDPQCGVCGAGPVAYDNYKGDLFCWRCADCDCGQDVCLRTGLHRQAEDDTGGPAVPGVLRCTATWSTEFHGIATCWRAAEHNTRDGYEIHVGETQTGYRYQWSNNEPGTTPHRPAPTERPCTATFHEPFHGLAHCEQHADRNPAGHPGPWHEGTSQDGSRLFWKDTEPGATPHRPDIVRTVQDTPPPDTTLPVRTPLTPDMNTPVPTSTDTAQTPGPDMSADTPSGVRMRYEARVPRTQMGAAWAEGLEHLHHLLAERQTGTADHDGCTPAEREERTILEARHNLLAQRQTDASDQPAQDTPTDEDLHLGPDGFTDTERERKTIRDTLRAELSTDEPDAVWTLTLAVQRALHAMPRHNPRRPGDKLVHPTTSVQVTGPDQVDENPAQLLHLVHGTVPLHEHLADVERSLREIDTLRARVGELAATLADVLGRFTVVGTVSGSATVGTSAVPTSTVERWRRIHTGTGPTGWMFPPVEGNCPACNGGSLFLGSGGYVTCPRSNCPNPSAPTNALQPPADECPRSDCTDTREQARRATRHYDSLRSDMISAAAYINQQRRLNPLAEQRHRRPRVLEGLGYWIKDPGPLNTPATRTESQ